MTEQFQPGDVVECVTDEPPYNGWTPLSPLKLGALYTVSRVERGVAEQNAADKDVSVLVKELPSHPVFGYWAGYFRKVYRPSADLIAKLTAQPVLPEAPKVKRRTEASAAREPAATSGKDSR